MAEEQQGDRRARSDPPSWKPVPDPTSLTTENLQREVSTLREIIDERVEALAGTVALHVAELKAANVEMRRYYDAILAERNTRFEERHNASEQAINRAFEASEKAISAAFEASDRAITKAEISIEKRADATYVALGELQRLLGGLMPRQEAEARYGNQEERIGTIGARVERLEAAKAGKTEMLPWVLAAVAVAGLVVTVAR